MMKLKITILIVICASTMHISGQSWTNSNILTSTNNVSEVSSATDLNNNIYTLGFFTSNLIAGATELTTYGSRDYFVTKFKEDGKLDWVRQLGGTSFEYVGGGLCTCEEGYLYATGGFQNDLFYTETDFISSGGGFDIFVTKYDTLGNVIWCKNIGTGADNQRSETVISNNNELIITGFFSDSITLGNDTTLYSTDGFDDFFFSAFDTAGNHIWTSQIKGLSSSQYGSLYSVKPETDAYVFSGIFADSIVLQNDTLVSDSQGYDVLVFKTDLSGNVLWKRTIGGNDLDYSFGSASDPAGNIYLGGYYFSPTLSIDSTETESTTISNNNGESDLFVLKYDPNGNLLWKKSAGSTGEDKILDIEFYDGKVHVSGFFADQISWGGIDLSTSGPSDRDMLYGSIDQDGTFRNANSYAGRNNSSEEARALFYSENGLLTVIRSNSDLLVLGDSIYTNPGQKYFIAVGTIGCLPISISTNKTDINTCFGDPSGTIFIAASDGFGSPYRYSIDNGSSYQTNDPNFQNLPAGTYEIIVADKQNCLGEGGIVTITQPTEVVVTSVDSADVLCFGETSGSIDVNATGGTGTLTFSVDGGGTFPNTVGTAVNVSAGVYSITVKDINDCIAMGGTATILEPEELTFSLLSTADVTCNGDMDGSIEVSAAGGTAPYEYSIDASTYQSESTIGSLSAGTYTPNVKDANGCETVLDSEVSINEPDELTITLVSNSDITDEADGEIVVSAAGGTAPYAYSINPSAGTQGPDSVFTFGAGEEGVYVVELDDANNCGPKSTASITISDLTNINDWNQINASIYPNPSSGMVTVEFTTDKVEMTMEVFSIDGRNVMHRQVYSSGGQVRETLDLSGLDKGMYMIRVDQQTLSNAVVLN